MHEAAIANGHGWVARQYHRQTMKLDPVSLRLFVAVMEESTIAAAAEREHMAASAVMPAVGSSSSIICGSIASVVAISLPQRRTPEKPSVADPPSA